MCLLLFCLVLLYQLSCCWMLLHHIEALPQWGWKCVWSYSAECRSADCHAAECCGITFNHWHSGYLNVFVVILPSVAIPIVMLLNVVAPYWGITTIGMKMCLLLFCGVPLCWFSCCWMLLHHIEALPQWGWKCVWCYSAECRSADCHVAECCGTPFNHWHSGYLNLFVVILLEG